jgi:transposase-like protein
MITKRMPARMSRLVAQWRQSGESRASFARRHRIPAWTFWYWCRKFSNAQTGEGVDRGAAMFVPLRVAGEAPVPVMEIVFVGSGNSDLLFPEILTKSVC